jgi:hypothetical protein
MKGALQGLKSLAEFANAKQANAAKKTSNSK